MDQINRSDFNENSVRKTKNRKKIRPQSLEHYSRERARQTRRRDPLGDVRGRNSNTSIFFHIKMQKSSSISHNLVIMNHLQKRDPHLFEAICPDGRKKIRTYSKKSSSKKGPPSFRGYMSWGSGFCEFEPKTKLLVTGCLCSSLNKLIN